VLPADRFARDLWSQIRYTPTITRLRHGFPIGSGVVESGAKQFKARFSGPGMRWSRTGAENLLPIRAAVLSDRFDQMWAAAKNSPQV
jgi:hypothetical protein